MVRLARMAAYWCALPRRMLQLYPEQTVFYSTFGVASFGLIIYKGRNFTFEGEKAYYRGYYSVFRPNDPIILNWRKPEEYPSPYLASTPASE